MHTFNYYSHANGKSEARGCSPRSTGTNLLHEPVCQVTAGHGKWTTGGGGGTSGPFKMAIPSRVPGM